VTCVVVFVPTWLLNPPDQSTIEQRLDDLESYYGTHPGLTLPARCADRFDIPEPRESTDLFGEPLSDEGEVVSAPESDQQHLEALCARALGQQPHPMASYGLVPARGAAQLGWLTHMFLHAGALHLFFNLFFLYLVGPLLEDRWGRATFAWFYFAGGMLAGLAQLRLDPSSTVPMVGASGAIAACIGAFTFRFAKKRVRMFYLITPGVRGTFDIPAWLWGLGWFGSELFYFSVMGDLLPVAFMAHIGGFAFGFAVAAAARVSGLQQRIETTVEKSYTWEEAPETPPSAPEEVLPRPASDRVITCQSVTLDRGAIRFETVDGPTTAPYSRVEAICVGLVGTPSGEAEPVTDLVLRPLGNAGRQVLRLPLSALGLPERFPNLSRSQAFRALLVDLFDRTDARRLPATSDSKMPRFEDLRSFELACHGRVLS
jgi:membrane associated rhomboid family serine protease